MMQHLVVAVLYSRQFVIQLDYLSQALPFYSFHSGCGPFASTLQFLEDMSVIVEAFNNILGKTPLSSSFPKVGLPLEEDEPLVGSKPSEECAKCELRIEGMTCGACVEVSSSLA
jgi:hypothetical protein